MKNKIITPEQIANIMATFYETNIPKKQYDIVERFFVTLPDEVELPKAEVPIAAPIPHVPPVGAGHAHCKCMSTDCTNNHYADCRICNLTKAKKITKYRKGNI